MRSKITAIIALFLLLFPAVAQNVKLEYNYPFYCSKDMALVFYIYEGYTDESFLFAYEGSPIEITITENEKVTYEKMRLTTPNQYYEIHPQNGGFLTFTIRSTGESTFDIDGGVKQAPLWYDSEGVSFLGNEILLAENALENYKIQILLPLRIEKFHFYTGGLDKGKVWIEDEKNKTRYELTPVNINTEVTHKPLKEYEVNTIELDWTKTWYVTFTDLKGTEKFYFSGDYRDNNTITVRRPRRFFTGEPVEIPWEPGMPRPIS